MKLLIFAFGLFGSLGNASGQQDPPNGPFGGPPGEMGHRMHEPPNGRRPPLRGPLPPESGPGGKWWNNPEVMRRLGLTGAQQKQMDQILQQSRLNLIDLRATLDKQELLLGPLLADEHPKEASVLPQIERIAAARAQLEKANARMLFEIRLVLTLDQWRELQEDRTAPRRP